MKKYKYHKINIDNRMFAPEVEDHREIIDAYAKQGYRYVGFIPYSIEYVGRIVELDLIFEIDIDNE